MTFWVELIVTAALAYVSTNVDGYALLLGFFSDARYRTVDIVAGQLVSFAAQLALSASVVALAFAGHQAVIGLLGIVPLSIGLKRIADRRRPGKPLDPALMEAPGTLPYPRLRTGHARRVATVAMAATSCATDNVLAYSATLVRRTLPQATSIVVVLAILTLAMCVCAFAVARLHIAPGAIRHAIRQLSPFVTAAIGMALLVRFDTLTWLCSFVRT
jgi:cadmium resistance protein CadD (predicted permease)